MKVINRLPLSDKETQMLNELDDATLRTMLATAEQHKTSAQWWLRENFYELFTPSNCAELAREVLRLREQWSTRFNTLCGNCGKHYLGPRDEHLHGIGICGGQR